MKNASRNQNAHVPIQTAGKNHCSSLTLSIIQNRVLRLASSKNTASKCATNSATKLAPRATNCTHLREVAAVAYLTYNLLALESWKESPLQRRMETSGFKENARIVNVKRVKRLVERFALS
jgi:hypothetical protein